MLLHLLHWSKWFQYLQIVTHTFVTNFQCKQPNQTTTQRIVVLLSNDKHSFRLLQVGTWKRFSHSFQKLVIGSCSCSCPSFSYSMSILEKAGQWLSCPCNPIKKWHWQFLTMCSGMPWANIDAWRWRFQKFILEVTSMWESLKVCCRNWRSEAHRFHSLHTKRSWKNCRSGNFAYTLDKAMWFFKLPHNSGSMIPDMHATHLQSNKPSSMS